MPLNRKLPEKAPAGLGDGNSLALLVSLLLLITIFPYFEKTEVGSTILVVLYTAVLLAGIYAVSYDVRYVAVGLLLAIPTFITGWSDAFNHRTATELAWMAFTIVFLVYTLAVVLRHVLASRDVSMDEIYGAVSVYVMIGLAFGMSYALLDTVVPGSFKYNEGTKSIASLTYLSFSTLSTVGFGDITPLTPFARSLSIVEMIIGATYVAVLIGILINPARKIGREGQNEEILAAHHSRAEHISLKKPWILILAAVMLNYASSLFMISLSLPFYMDSWGTSLAVLMGGLPAGLLAGVAYNLLMALTVWGASYWVWLFSSVLVALATWHFKNLGWVDLHKPGKLLAAGAATGFMNAVLSWIIIAAAGLVPYKGTLPIYDLIYGYTGNSSMASLLEQVTVEIADKSMSLVLAAVFVLFLSDHIRTRRVKREAGQRTL